MYRDGRNRIKPGRNMSHRGGVENTNSYPDRIVLHCSDPLHGPFGHIYHIHSMIAFHKQRILKSWWRYASLI